MYQNVTVLAAREYVVICGSKTEDRTLVLLEGVEETREFPTIMEIAGKGGWFHVRWEFG